MFRNLTRCALLLPLTVSLIGCGATARLAVSDGIGATPVLPEPNPSLLPTVNVVSAKGWSESETPAAAPSLDGVAETRSVLVSGLNSPFGMALLGSVPHWTISATGWCLPGSAFA